MIYNICRVRKDRAIAQPKNPKGRKEVKRGGRREQRHSSDGHTANIVNPPEATNFESAVVEETPMDQTSSAVESENGGRNEEGEEIDCESNVSTDADLHENVLSEGNSDGTEQSDPAVTELLPERTTLQKRKKKQEKRKSHIHIRRHPPQPLAQPTIDPSQIARLSDMHNYLRTAEGRRKVRVFSLFELVAFAFSFLQSPYLQQQGRELGLIRHRISDLQDKLRECRAEGAHLVEEKANIIQRLENTKRIGRGLDHEIKASWMAKLCSLPCSSASPNSSLILDTMTSLFYLTLYCLD